MDEDDEQGAGAAIVRAAIWHAMARTGAYDLTGARAPGAIPLVYVDKNPWGRHRDDPSVSRNVAEAEAFDRLKVLLRSGEARLVYSSISFGEGVPRAGSPSASGDALREVLDLRAAGVPVLFHDVRADTEAVAELVWTKWRIRGMDAIHAAAALLEGAWYFVTGDDRLQKRLGALYSDLILPATAETPVSVLERISNGSRL